MKQPIQLTNFGDAGEVCAIDGTGCSPADAAPQQASCGCGGAAGACACGGHGAGKHEAAASGTSTGSGTETFSVTGMTCGHCVGAVTTELDGVEGITGVDVDLVAGGVSTVTVQTSQPLDVDEVRIAISEAGYRLVEA